MGGVNDEDGVSLGGDEDDDMMLIRYRCRKLVVRLPRYQLCPHSRQLHLPKNKKRSMIHLALVVKMDIVQPSAPLLAAHRPANHCLH